MKRRVSALSALARLASAARGEADVPREQLEETGALKRVSFVTK